MNVWSVAYHACVQSVQRTRSLQLAGAWMRFINGTFFVVHTYVIIYCSQIWMSGQWCITHVCSRYKELGPYNWQAREWGSWTEHFFVFSKILKSTRSTLWKHPLFSNANFSHYISCSVLSGCLILDGICTVPWVIRLTAYVVPGLRNLMEEDSMWFLPYGDPDNHHVSVREFSAKWHEITNVFISVVILYILYYIPQGRNTKSSALINHG